MKNTSIFLSVYLFCISTVFGQGIANTNNPAVTNNSISACNIGIDSDTLRVEFAISDISTMTGGQVIVDLDDNIEYVASSFVVNTENTAGIALNNVSADLNIVTVDLTSITSIGQVVSFTIQKRLNACTRPFVRPLEDLITVNDMNSLLVSASGGNPFSSNPYNQSYPQLTISSGSVTNNPTSLSEATSRSVDVNVGAGVISEFVLYEAYPTGEFTYEPNSFTVNGNPIEPTINVVSGIPNDTIYFTIDANEIAFIGNANNLFEDGESATFTYDFNWVNCYIDQTISSRIGGQYGCENQAPCQDVSNPLTSTQSVDNSGNFTFQLDSFTANKATCPGVVTNDVIELTYTGNFVRESDVSYFRFLLFDGNNDFTFFSNVQLFKNGSPIAPFSAINGLRDNCGSGAVGNNSNLDIRIPGPLTAGDQIRLEYDWENCIPTPPVGCTSAQPFVFGSETVLRFFSIVGDDGCGSQLEIQRPAVDILSASDNTPILGEFSDASQIDVEAGEEMLITTNTLLSLLPLSDFPNQTLSIEVCLPSEIVYTGDASKVRLVKYDDDGLETNAINLAVSGSAPCFTLSVDPIDLNTYSLLIEEAQLEFPVDAIGNGDKVQKYDIPTSFNYIPGSGCAEIDLGCVENSLVIVDALSCTGDLAIASSYTLQNPVLMNKYSGTTGSTTETITQDYANLTKIQSKVALNDDLQAVITGNVEIPSTNTYSRLGFYIHIPESDTFDLYSFVDGSAEVIINGTPETVNLSAPELSNDTLFFDMSPTGLALNNSGSFTATVNFKVPTTVLNNGVNDIENYEAISSAAPFLTNSTNNIPLLSERLECIPRFAKNTWYSTAFSVANIATSTTRQCYVYENIAIEEGVNRIRDENGLVRFLSANNIEFPNAQKTPAYSFNELLITPSDGYELFAVRHRLNQTIQSTDGAITITMDNCNFNSFLNGNTECFLPTGGSNQIPFTEIGGGVYRIDMSNFKNDYIGNRSSEFSYVSLRLFYRLKDETCNVSLNGTVTDFPNYELATYELKANSPVDGSEITSTYVNNTSLEMNDGRFAYRQAVLSNIDETLTSPSGGSFEREANITIYGELVPRNNAVAAKNYYFFYENKTDNATLEEVTLFDATATENANGLFEIGQCLDRANISDYTAQFKMLNDAGCLADTLTIYVGSTCDITGYPINRADFCKEDSIRFILEEKLPDFNLTMTAIQNTPTDPTNPSSPLFGKTTVDVCEQIPVEVRIKSSQTKDLFDVIGVFNIPTGNGGNPGLEYVQGSATIAYPSNAAPVAVDAIAETNLASQFDGSLEFLLEEMLPSVFNDSNGLPGLFDLNGNTRPNEDTEVTIRFLVETTCDFISGSIYNFAVTNADDDCGRDAQSEGLANFGSVLQIDGLTPPFESNLVVENGIVFEGCNDTQDITFDFLKISNGPIDLTRDYIQIAIPSNLTLDAIVGTSTDVAINATISTVDVTEVENVITERKSLTWSVPDMSTSINNGAGQTLSYRLTFTYNGTNMCSTSSISSIIYREQELTCGASTCPAVINPAGVSNQTISYAKSQVEITNFDLEGDTSSSTDDILATYEVNYTNSTAINADNLVIDLYLDADDSGAFSAGDTLIETINVGALTAGANGTRTGSVTYTDATNSRAVFAVVDSEKTENCFCETNELSADITLPVVLSNFKAEIDNCIVALYWTTETETNNSHFVLERSSNGMEYAEVAIVEGNGTSLTANNYNYVDSPSTGAWMYRLKQVDFDGSVEYSNIISVTTNCVNDVTLITPNPVLSEAIIFYTTQGGNDLEFQIINMQGQIMQVIEIEKAQGRISQPIQVEDYPNGVYVVMIIDGDIKDQVRFVKQ